MRIQISAKLHDQICDIRNSKLTHMMNRQRVKEIAKARGHDELVTFITEHRMQYGQGICYGFQIEEDLEILGPAAERKNK